MTTTHDPAIEAAGNALRAECLKIFGATWDNDVAWRLAQAALTAAGYFQIRERLQRLEARQYNKLEESQDELLRLQILHDANIACTAVNKKYGQNIAGPVIECEVTRDKPHD